jgi:hypothetical protein
MLVVIGRKKQDLRDRIDHPAVDPFFVEVVDAHKS